MNDLEIGLLDDVGPYRSRQLIQEIFRFLDRHSLYIVILEEFLDLQSNGIWELRLPSEIIESCDLGAQLRGARIYLADDRLQVSDGKGVESNAK